VIINKAFRSERNRTIPYVNFHYRVSTSSQWIDKNVPVSFRVRYSDDVVCKSVFSEPINDAQSNLYKAIIFHTCALVNNNMADAK